MDVSTKTNGGDIWKQDNLAICFTYETAAFACVCTASNFNGVFDTDRSTDAYTEEGDAPKPEVLFIAQMYCMLVNLYTFLNSRNEYPINKNHLGDDFHPGNTTKYGRYLRKMLEEKVNYKNGTGYTVINGGVAGATTGTIIGF